MNIILTTWGGKYKISTNFQNVCVKIFKISNRQNFGIMKILKFSHSAASLIRLSDIRYLVLFNCKIITLSVIIYLSISTLKSGRQADIRHLLLSLRKLSDKTTRRMVNQI